MELSIEHAKKLIAFCNISGKGWERYQLIQSILETKFHLPEFDMVREEFGRCYVVEAYQACITLTNHLLERYLKIFLITKETGFTKLTSLIGLEDLFAKANEKYLGLDLSATLKKFKSLNLISKEDWKIFDSYREQIRNGFGHADPRKIFGNDTGEFVLGSLSNDRQPETERLSFANIPMLQGIALQMFSKANALKYFVEVENLIRKTINHIQADEDKVKYQLVKLVFGEQPPENG